MIACPNKSTPAWQNLVKKYGDTKAMYMYTKNGEVIPSLEEAAKLLKFKSIREQVSIGMIETLVNKANKVRAAKKLPNIVITRNKSTIGSLASFNSSTGVLNITPNINPSVIVDYMMGNDISTSSKQKKIMLAKIEAEEFSLEEIKSLLHNDEDAFNFLLFHELSHVIYEDSASYPKDKEGNLDLLHERAIAIETRATIEALNSLKAINSDEEVYKADAKKKETPGNSNENKNTSIWDSVTKSIVDVLKLRKEYFERFEGSEGFDFGKNSINRIEALLAMANNTTDQKVMFKRLLNNATIELDKVRKYLNNPEKRNDPNYLRNIIEFKKYIASYQGLTRPDLAFDDKTRKDIITLSSQLVELKTALPGHILDSVKELAREKLSKGASMTDEELDTMLKQGYDISLSDMAFRDLSTSTDKLLALVDKLYKDAEQKSLDKLDTFESKVKALGRKLVSVGVTTYDWMFEKDGDRTTGNYIRKISKEYYKKLYELKDKMSDDTGATLQYKHITDTSKASVADLQYNKMVKRVKANFADFITAERLEEGNLLDGDNVKYTDEFKAARAKHEEHVEVGEKGYKEWVKKASVSAEEYERYKYKYFTEPKLTLKAIPEFNKVLNKYEFTGKTDYRTVSFVKAEYTEVREDKWGNKEYLALMNDNSESGKAKRDFYKFFAQQMEDPKGLLSALPKDVRSDMKGRIPVVIKSFKKQLLNSDAGKLSVLGRAIKGMFNVEVFEKKRQTDEQGLLVSDVPIFHTQRLRNERTIERLKDKIADIKQGTDQTELEKYQKALKIEESKPTASEMETDLVDVLLNTANMAYNYEAMKNIESSVLAIKDVIETKKYYQKSGSGILKNQSGEPALVEGKDSLAAKRLSTWMRMVLYDNSEMDNTKIAKFSKTVLKYNSLKGIGLNPFSAINNYVMARINTSIEAAGGKFFQQSSGNKATALFNTEFLPNIFKEINQSKYAEKKASSKYKAVVDYFRFIKHQASIDGRTSNGDVFDFAYSLQDGGEFAAQSRSGIAMLMDTYNIDGKWMLYSEIKEIHKDKTEDFLKDKKSLYDSMEFDPSTGALKTPEALSNSDKHRLTNRIIEMNKYIHGNYAWEDRMAIQEHWLGQFAAQFHKWVYPAIKSRFGEQQHYEGLDLDMKGRYITLFEFLKHNKFTVANYYDSYTKLSEIDKANMRKNMRELAFFMTSLALFHLFSAISEGIDDDDEELKKLVNFLAFQQNRQMGEIQTLIPVFGIRQQYDLIKSPFAAASTVKEGGEMLRSMITTPVYGALGVEGENFYKKGIHKGDLKLWKETKDFIPFLTIFNKYDNFINQQEFWVK